MITFAALDAPYARDLWARAVASTALDEASDALSDAGIALDALIDATHWQVKAGEQLNGRLVALLSRVRSAGRVVVQQRQMLDRVQPW
ncbi:hypothetical protein [Microbacterium sp. NPDC057650]|uniref:hypothetical protein n=1 Tax=unclassified Microbacterium TaxID=2609290 RepID=UPI00367039E4